MKVDEDIAPNIHTADPVSMGRKSCLYTILEYSVRTGATFCSIPTGSAVHMYVFGAISSSSILWAYLFIYWFRLQSLKALMEIISGQTQQNFRMEYFV